MDVKQKTKTLHISQVPLEVLHEMIANEKNPENRIKWYKQIIKRQLQTIATLTDRYDKMERMIGKAIGLNDGIYRL